VGAKVERKMLPWSFVFDQELYELSRFNLNLRADDRAVFDDLIAQCRHCAPVGEVLPSPERKMSLLFWMIFAQHKRIMELETCLGGLDRGYRFLIRRVLRDTSPGRAEAVMLRLLLRAKFLITKEHTMLARSR
jgi:hypothetical protein